MAVALRRPRRFEFTLSRLWHALLVGGFVVAYATGDEDTYAMHLFAGWLVVGVVTLRLLAAAVAPENSPLKLVRPNRARVFIWAAVGALAAAGLAAVTGVVADTLPVAEGLHEAIGEGSAFVAAAHVAVAVAVFKGRAWLARWKAAAVVPGLVVALAWGTTATPAKAGEPAHDAILAAYAAQARGADAGFAGFSAARGEALFRSRNTANPAAAACTACHTDDPAAIGRHVKTGRAIEPVAVSANAKRFTDTEKVEERFGRDCKSVLGRACTAVEKGDYVTFMASR